MAVSHRTNRLKLIGTPAVEQLQNGRYQLTVNCTTMNSREDWYSSNKARIFPDFGSLESAEMSIDGLAPRTGEAYTNMRLVSVQSSTQQEKYLITLVYETLGDSFVQVKDDTVSYTESGLRRVTRESIAKAGTSFQKTVGTTSISSQIDGETAVTCILASYEVDDTDSYREVTELYIEAGTISETKDKVGSQLAIVKETFASTPTAPDGYSIANEQESNVDGIPTKRFTFLKNNVTLSETEDKVGSQLAIVKEVFNGTPSTPSGYSIANEQESNVDGIPTRRFTFLRPSVLSRNISERNGGIETTGKLRTEVVEAFGPTDPSTTISGVKIGEEVSNVEGIPTKRLTFAKGAGEISRSSRQSTGALAGTTELTVTTYGTASTEGSVLIASSDFEEDGYKRFVRTFLTGTITGVKQTYQDVVSVDVPGEIKCTKETSSITTAGAVSFSPAGTVAIVQVTPRRSKRIVATVTIEVTSASPTTFEAAYSLGQISCSVTTKRESFNVSAGFLETNQNYTLSANTQAYPGCFITESPSEGSVEYASSFKSEGPQPPAASRVSTTCVGFGSTEATGWSETGILKRKSRPLLTDLNGTTYYEVITWSVSA
tara:strand:- start:2342 stop:4147 length:1806 start_codon:yes stop_codon:yes gene_type:complete